jgi:hypothetical protein
VKALLDGLVAAGLLRKSTGAAPGDDFFDLVHEALIQHWPRLRGWLRDRRQELVRELQQVGKIHFSRDIVANSVCHTFSEAQNSGPFDVVIIGGGTFGLALAHDLFFRTQRQGPGSIPQDGLRPPSSACSSWRRGRSRSTSIFRTSRTFSSIRPALSHRSRARCPRHVRN